MQQIRALTCVGGRHSRMHTGLGPPLKLIITLATRDGLSFQPVERVTEKKKKGQRDRGAKDRWGEGGSGRESAYFTSIHLLTWPLKETFH